MKEQLAEARKAAKEAVAEVRPAEGKASAAEAAVAEAKDVLDRSTAALEAMQRGVADADTVVKETRKSRNNAVCARAPRLCAMRGTRTYLCVRAYVGEGEE